MEDFILGFLVKETCIYDGNLISNQGLPYRSVSIHTNYTILVIGMEVVVILDLLN